MAEEKEDHGELETAAEKHRKFHNRVAALFLVLAGIIGLWMIFGPEQANPIVLLLVQLPLFVILAFIGVKALLKSAKGIPSRKR